MGNKKIIIIGSIVLLIVIGIGGVIFVLGKSGTQVASTQTSAQITNALDSITPTSTPTSNTSNQSNSNTSNSTSSNFKDGTYSADGSYISPGGHESIGVQLSVSNGVIESVTVTPESKDFESLRYQQRFISGVASVVVGKKLDQAYINGRVNGSSLTPEGFNNALGTIISEAKVS